MQRMTKEMGRLRKEINAGHKARQKLRKSLAEFRRGLQRNVASTMNHMHLANAEMFARARNMRLEFIQGTSKEVGDLCKAWRADRMGARRAWQG